MKAYFAGALGFEFNHPRLQAEVRNRLLSYHYMKGNLNQRFYNYPDEIGPDGNLAPGHRDRYNNIIVDSGAFSVWNKGDTIDLDKYIEYCLKYNSKVDYVVNLDVIPATPGDKKPSPEEVERSASKGYDNYNYMISKGVPKEKLIHVFHQGESYHWLTKMVHEDKMEYIGLSPANDRTTKEKVEWLHECMPYVTDSEGRAIVKFHGFAVTSFKLMSLFPWYSVDSATWGIAAGLGRVFLPRKRDGVWDYSSTRPEIFAISQVKSHKTHLAHHAKIVRNVYEEYFTDLGLKMGVSKFIKVPKDYKVESAQDQRDARDLLEDDSDWSRKRRMTEKLVITMAEYLDIKEREEGRSGVSAKGERIPGSMCLLRADDPALQGFDEKTEKLVEIIVEEGVTNSVETRQFLNCHYINKFAQTLPEIPVWINDRPVGFGF